MYGIERKVEQERVILDLRKDLENLVGESNGKVFLIFSVGQAGILVGRTVSAGGSPR